MKIIAKTEGNFTGELSQWATIDITGKTSSINDNTFYYDGCYYLKNTICRVTDIEDANGRIICENDRLKPANSYIVPELMTEEEYKKTVDLANCFSNPVVRWVPERSAFYLVSECIIQTPPKAINTDKAVHADYEVDHIRTVRFVALTKDEAKNWVVYGNTIDNPDDSDYRVIPPKDADDFDESDMFDDD